MKKPITVELQDDGSIVRRGKVYTPQEQTRLVVDRGYNVCERCRHVIALRDRFCPWCGARVVNSSGWKGF